MPYTDRVNRKRTMDHFSTTAQIEEFLPPEEFTVISGLTDEQLASLFQVTVDELWGQTGVTCQEPTTWTWKPPV
jgi:ferric iron reductase protein FhuF